MKINRRSHRARERDPLKSVAIAGVLMFASVVGFLGTLKALDPLVSAAPVSNVTTYSDAAQRLTQHGQTDGTYVIPGANVNHTKVLWWTSSTSTDFTLKTCVFATATSLSVQEQPGEWDDSNDDHVWRPQPCAQQLDPSLALQPSGQWKRTPVIPKQKPPAPTRAPVIDVTPSS